MQKQIPTIKYSGLQGGFWMSFCICFSYASIYLLSRGYSNSQIGLVIAVAGVISSVLQPLVAGLADGEGRYTLRGLIMFLSVIMLLSAIILLFPQLHFLWIAVLYIVLLAVLQILTPLVNAIGMDWINKGIPVNFGLARGVGSVSYALISFVAGIVIERHSASVVPLFIILCYLIVFIAAYIFRLPDRTGAGEYAGQADSGTQAACETRTEQGTKAGLSVGEPHMEQGAQAAQAATDDGAQEFSFFRTYRKFFVLLIGISFVFVSHNMLNNYMFQVMSYHHGGSSETGIASGIAAALELPTMIAFSYLIKKASSGTLLKVSCIFFALKAFLTFMAVDITGVYLAQIAQIGGFALSVPASVYYTNSLIRPKDRAKGQSFMTVTNTVGSIFGSTLGGLILDVSGVPAMLIAATLAAVFGTLLAFVSTEKCQDIL